MSDTLPSSQRPIVSQCRKVSRRFAVYCTAMAQMLREQKEDGKGLSEMSAWEGEEGVTLIGLIYREKYKAQGIMLNLCPWCGESLRWWPDKEKVDG